MAKRGRPKGSKNKKKTAVVKKVAKKRGRPAGSKNKTTTTTTKKKGATAAAGERLDRVFMIEDMFYSSTRTEEAKEEYEKAYPGEEKFFKKEWGRVAGDVANVMLGRGLSQ